MLTRNPVNNQEVKAVGAIFGYLGAEHLNINATFTWKLGSSIAASYSSSRIRQPELFARTLSVTAAFPY